MRTTVTLDPDVHHMVQRAMRERGLSFKDALNEAIRSGLRPYRVSRYKQKTYSMGFSKVSLDKALQLASALDDEAILKKMAREK